MPLRTTPTEHLIPATALGRQTHASALGSNFLQVCNGQPTAPWCTPRAPVPHSDGVCPRPPAMTLAAFAPDWRLTAHVLLIETSTATLQGNLADVVQRLSPAVRRAPAAPVAVILDTTERGGPAMALCAFPIRGGLIVDVAIGKASTTTFGRDRVQLRKAIWCALGIHATNPAPCPQLPDAVRDGEPSMPLGAFPLQLGCAVYVRFGQAATTALRRDGPHVFDGRLVPTVVPDWGCLIRRSALWNYPLRLGHARLPVGRV